MKKYVFTDNKNLFKKIIAGALAVVSILFLVAICFMVDGFSKVNPKCYHRFILSTFHGSYDEEGLPSTYWQVIPRIDNNTGAFLTVRADIELDIYDYAETKVDQIWINVSDFVGDKLEVGTFTYTDSNVRTYNSYNVNNLPFVITREQIKNSKDGWFKVYDTNDTVNFKSSRTYNYMYSLAFKDEVRIREIVFISSKQEVLKEVKHSNEYLERQPNNDAKNPIKNAVDEPTLFDINKIKG